MGRIGAALLGALLLVLAGAVRAEAPLPRIADGPARPMLLVDGKPYTAEIPGLETVEVDEDSQGGLHDKVIIRTFKAASITAVRVDKQEFVL